MYATIIKTVDGIKLRSSFFKVLKEAIEYSERMPGILEIEEIGNGIVWERKNSKYKGE